MKVLFLSHSIEEGIFRVGSHHLSHAIASQGNTVVHASTPVTPLHLARLRSSDNTDGAVRVRIVHALHGLEPRTSQYGTLVPIEMWPRTQLASNLLFDHTKPRLAGHAIQKFLHGDPDIILVDQPSMSNYLGLFPHATVVTRGTDLPNGSLGERLFRQSVNCSDGIVGTSEPVRKTLSALSTRPLPSMALTNGVDVRRFSDPTHTHWKDRADCVYVGALDERLDWALVSRLAQDHPDLTFDLWGPLPQHAPEIDMCPQNVRLRGPISYERVPQLLSHYRIGLLPFSDVDSNRGRSPMKLYEYLLAGLIVVGVSTESLKDVSSLRDVRLGSTPSEISDSLGAAYKTAPTGDGIAAAYEEDWDKKATRLLRFAVALNPHECASQFDGSRDMKQPAGGRIFRESDFDD